VGSLSGHSAALNRVAGNLDSPIHRLDPRAKLLGLLGLVVVAVSTPLGAWPVFVACALALAAVAALAAVSPAQLWSRSRLVLALVLAVALVVPLTRTGGAAHQLGPLTVHGDGLTVLATVAAKSAIGVVAAVLLAATTPFPSLLQGLAALRVPRVLVLIAALMYRYAFVVVDEVGRMRTALAARAYRPRNPLQAAALGKLAAGLFLRAHARAERVHVAMLARGYDGTMPAPAPLSPGPADAIFVVALLAAAVPLRVALGLGQ